MFQRLKHTSPMTEANGSYEMKDLMTKNSTIHSCGENRGHPSIAIAMLLIDTVD